MRRITEAARAWFVNRQPRSDSQALTQRNLYILPTRGGWGFCITLLVMLVASINYQLNLGYALTFLLGSAALVSMHQTHGNLRRLTLRLRAPAPVFAGTPATLEIVLDNPSGRDRPAVGLGWHAARRHGMAFVDVPAQGSVVARLRHTPAARGRLACPAVLVETHFPLGLFRAWTVWRPATELLVYPAPEHPAPALPAGQASTHGALPNRHSTGGEFVGVRAWRRGDTSRQVLWKKVARSGGSGELVSRDMGASAARALVLDWQAAREAGRWPSGRTGLAGTQAADGQRGQPGQSDDAEARLSRLTAWVLAAERQGMAFALQLPGQQLASASGEQHGRNALQALALWRAAGATKP